MLNYKKNATSREWVRVNFSKSDYKDLLPPRAGARLQRWWPKDEEPRYQVWYPPNEGDKQQSRTFHGYDGFAQAQSWAWERHVTWLASLNS